MGEQRTHVCSAPPSEITPRLHSNGEREEDAAHGDREQQPGDGWATLGGSASALSTDENGSIHSRFLSIIVFLRLINARYFNPFGSETQ